MFKSLKSLREIATHLHFIRCGIDDLAHALKDWAAACTEESGEAGGIVKAKNLKPGWRVDGRKVISVTPSLGYIGYPDGPGYTYVRFSGDSEPTTFRPDSLILVDKEERQ